MLREKCGTRRADEPRESRRRCAVDGLVLDGFEVLPVIAPADEDVESWFDGDDVVTWVCREVRGTRAVLGRVASHRDRLLSRARRGESGGRS